MQSKTPSFAKVKYTYLRFMTRGQLLFLLVWMDMMVNRKRWTAILVSLTILMGLLLAVAADNSNPLQFLAGIGFGLLLAILIMLVLIYIK